MINADFFLENISSLQQDRSLLKRLIDDYFRQFKKTMKRYSRFQSTKNYVDAIGSFDRHVAGKEGIYRIDKMKVLDELVKLYKLHE